ncbi:ComEC/Rec2 family competence protein [Nocardia sp. NPDC058058]|uniref:ComEC/Rec2 family competence protein n=1 Tax=Nocardia sp. NPDC058058 TaxID=3346317 RepID=UPI0036DBFAEB
MATGEDGARMTSGAGGEGEGAGELGEEVPEELDARLVPAAFCCWGATIVALVGGWRIGIFTAVGCLLLGVGVWALLIRSGGWRRGAGWVMLAAFSVGAGFAGAGAWHEWRVAGHPLRAVGKGVRVQIAVVVTDDPKVLAEKKFGGNKVMLRGDLVEFRAGGKIVRGGGAVVVLAPEAGWRGLLPGQEVVFRSRVANAGRADLTVAILRAEGPPMRVGEPPWWQRAAGQVRGDFATAAQRSLPGDAAGLLPGLVIGDTSRLPDRVRENFRETDLAHLTAVSGANITILLAAVLVSMRVLTVDPRVGAVAAGIALMMFVILARPSPSVLRAAVMGAVALLALCTGRRKQALPALCTAIIVLLGWSPQLAMDAGFALSALATAGLIVLAPGWSDWLRAHGWWRIPADAFAVAAAAFVVTTPVVIALTGHLSLVAIVVNVLVEPVIAPITIVGALGAILSCCWTPIAELVLYCTASPLWWLLTVAERFAALGASITLPTGVRSGVVAAVLCGLLLAGLRPRAPRPDTPS